VTEVRSVNAVTVPLGTDCDPAEYTNNPSALTLVTLVVPRFPFVPAVTSVRPEALLLAKLAIASDVAVALVIVAFVAIDEEASDVVAYDVEA